MTGGDFVFMLAAGLCLLVAVLGLTWAKRITASADTHPKDGDAQQAPLVSGAVPRGDEADAQ